MLILYEKSFIMKIFAMLFKNFRTTSETWYFYLRSTVFWITKIAVQKGKTMCSVEILWDGLVSVYYIFFQRIIFIKWINLIWAEHHALGINFGELLEIVTISTLKQLLLSNTCALLTLKNANDKRKFQLCVPTERDFIEFLSKINMTFSWLPW